MYCKSYWKTMKINLLNLILNTEYRYTISDAIYIYYIITLTKHIYLTARQLKMEILSFFVSCIFCSLILTDKDIIDKKKKSRN